MDSRYAVPEIDTIFSPGARLQRWLDVELAVLDALVEIGVVPAEDGASARASAPEVGSAFVAQVEAREQKVRHDVAAFVDVVELAMGEAGRWIHFGLTSSDVVDTALAMALREAGAVIEVRAWALFESLRDRAMQLRDVVVVGRTHGRAAEPTTQGRRLALWALQVHRDIERLEHAVAGVAVGRIAGPVGTHASVGADVEERACTALGLAVAPGTQVTPRDGIAWFVFALASLATTCDAVATNLRLLAQTGVDEFAEETAASQKGSSAMPHKRNPVRCERISGLARVVRAYVAPAMDDVVLWLERDLSHSSVERVILPDAVALTAFLLEETADVVTGGEFPTSLAHSTPATLAVLLALVRSGRGRDDAYRVVQAALADGTFDDLARSLDLDPGTAAIDDPAVFNMLTGRARR